MNVGNNGSVVAALAKFGHDVLEVLRVVDARGGDTEDFTACLNNRERFVDTSLRLHRVGNQHRLDADRVVAADTDRTDLYFTGDAPLPKEWIRTVVHGWVAGSVAGTLSLVSGFGAVFNRPNVNR